MSKTGDGSWGYLADTEHFGRSSCKCDYQLIKLEDIILPIYNTSTQAGHCMLYAKYEEKIFGIYNPRAAVLMQMRFDGYLGFPGGLIDEGENITEGLNRELVEELHFDVKKFSLTDEHYVVSHWQKQKSLLLHFYAREVPLDDFKQIEKNALVAHDYGSEVLGIIRVPLYTMGDGYRGFPAFLSNAFVGNSREQLLYSLVQHNIMSREEIAKAIDAKPV